MNASGLSPDQVNLQIRARELAAGPVAKRAAEVDRTEQYPWDNIDLLKDAKLIGMTIPTQYGGPDDQAGVVLRPDHRPRLQLSRR